MSLSCAQENRLLDNKKTRVLYNLHTKRKKSNTCDANSCIFLALTSKRTLSIGTLIVQMKITQKCIGHTVTWRAHQVKSRKLGTARQADLYQQTSLNTRTITTTMIQKATVKTTESSDQTDKPSLIVVALSDQQVFVITLKRKSTLAKKRRRYNKQTDCETCDTHFANSKYRKPPSLLTTYN